MKVRLFLILLFSLLSLTAKSVRPLVWVLDAGHGGKDMGTEGLKSQEKDINLEVTKEVQRLLKLHKPGIKVILTRSTDEFISLEERCNIANNAGADLFVSIHVNYAINKPLLKGTETYYASSAGMTDAVLLSAYTRNKDKSEMLAWLMQKNYFDVGRVVERGAKPERLYVLTHTTMPAVLTEIGFMSNFEEEVYMNTKRGIKEIAQCIYNALNDYYTVTKENREKKTLKNLRNTNGTWSGLKNDKVAEPLPPVEEQTVAAQTEEQPQAEQQTEVLAENTTEVQPEMQPAANTVTEAVPVAEETVVEAKTETTPEPEPEPETVAPPSPAVPVFSIQLFATSTELKATDAQLKGVGPVTYVKAGTMFKCLYGGTTDYKKAKETLTEIRQKFPDAFIVAYLGEEPITTARALELSNP